jgi:hypothetical protein
MISTIYGIAMLVAAIGIVFDFLKITNPKHLNIDQL